MTVNTEVKLPVANVPTILHFLNSAGSKN